MAGFGGVGNAIALVSVLDVVFRLFTNIAIACLCIKGIQALNVYINKSRM